MRGSYHNLLALVGKSVGEGSPLMRDFEQLLTRGDGFDSDSWLDEVDGSDYSLFDWVEAFVEFDRWLDLRGEARRPLESMRGYIHCCALMQPPVLSLVKLKVIVAKSLTEYGFDAVSEAQI